jgi:hypothetical protein
MQIQNQISEQTFYKILTMSLLKSRNKAVAEPTALKGYPGIAF